MHDGHRESEQSWHEVLQDLKSRGLSTDPDVAVGDGALGFWKALPKVWPSTKAQRCWVHKMANVLNKLPKKLQPTAKDALHQIWMADTREAAGEAFDHFLATYGPKYPKAAACLAKDREELLVFFDYPAEHWIHLANDEPDRVHVRNRPTTDQEDQGFGVAQGVPRDGLQARSSRRAQVAEAERIPTPR